MKRITLILVFGLFVLPSALFGQLEMIDEAPSNPNNEPAEVFPVPSERQMKWQETEFYAFFHYGMNTYTGLEWG
ncbi:MAG: carbohydrate-binding protein, partial [Bacteroidaceae bacterium]|nr:carbohydrate-binding protein [Bacteroidaceae bacterium]